MDIRSEKSSGSERNPSERSAQNNTPLSCSEKNISERRNRSERNARFERSPSEKKNIMSKPRNPYAHCLSCAVCKVISGPEDCDLFGDHSLPLSALSKAHQHRILMMDLPVAPTRFVSKVRERVETYYRSINIPETVAESLTEPSVAEASLLQKFLPKDVLAALSFEGTLRFVSALWAVIRLFKREKSDGVLAWALDKMTLGILLYDVLTVVWETLNPAIRWGAHVAANFDFILKFISDLYFDTEPEDSRLLIFRVLAGLGVAVAFAGGLNVNKATTMIKNIGSAVPMVEGTLSTVLWELFSIDLTGQHALQALADEACKKSLEFRSKPLEEFDPPTVTAMEAHVHEMERLTRLPGLKAPTLVSEVQVLSAKLVEVRAAIAAKMAHVTPLTVFMTGPPGIGKSAFVKKWAASLGKALNTHQSYFILGSPGSYHMPFMGEPVAFWDEFGARKTKEGSHLGESLNALCAGDPVALPTAGLSGKEQVPHFSSIIIASNTTPSAHDLGMTTEAYEAFLTRVVLVTVEDPLVDATRNGRDGYAHRRDDFSNLMFTFKPGTRHEDLGTRNGREFMNWMYGQIAVNRKRFDTKTLTIPLDLSPTQAEGSPSPIFWTSVEPSTLTSVLNDLGTISSQLRPGTNVVELSGLVEPVPQDGILVLGLHGLVEDVDLQARFVNWYTRNFSRTSPPLFVVASKIPTHDTFFGRCREWKSRDEVFAPVAELANLLDTAMVAQFGLSTAEVRGRGRLSHVVALKQWLLGPVCETLSVVEGLPQELDFDRTQADLWIEMGRGGPDVIGAPSMRTVRYVPRFLRAMASSHMDVLQVYRRLLSEGVDFKVCFKGPDTELKINGRFVSVVKHEVSRYSYEAGTLRLGNADVQVPVSDQELEELYWTGTCANPVATEAWRNLTVASQDDLYASAFAFTTRVSIYVRRRITSLTKFVQQHLAPKTWLVLSAVAALVGLYWYRSSGVNVKPPTKTSRPGAEARRQNTKAVYASDGTAFAVCSDPDLTGRHDRKRNIREAERARDDYDTFMDDELEIRASTMYPEEPLSKLFKQLDQASPRVREAVRRHLNGEPESIVTDLGGPRTEQDALLDALDQNLVSIKKSYGLMLGPQVGVVPYHCGQGDFEVEWEEVDSENTVLKTFRGRPFFSSPERELVFFKLETKEGRPAQGPFMSLARYVVGSSDLEGLTSACLVTQKPNTNQKLITPGTYVFNRVTTKLATQTLGNWTHDGGELYYALVSTEEHPTGPGSCGQPVIAWVNGHPRLIGIHAAANKSMRCLLSAALTQEVWREAQASATVAESDTVPCECPPFHDHPRLMTALEKSYRGPVVEGHLQPHGPGLVNIGSFQSRIPADTRASKVRTELEIPDWASKVPTISAAEILKQMPAKVTPDAHGNRHVAYTRMAASNAVVTPPHLTRFVDALAEEYLVTNPHPHLKGVSPLSLNEAVMGNAHTKPIERHTSAGVFLQTALGVKEKADLVDYNLETREVTWKGKKGEFVRDLAQQQMEAFKRGDWYSFPNSVGLKSELLPIEKLHKKRVFIITALPTLLNQRRYFMPVQRRLDLGPKGRFIFTFDPLSQSDELLTSILEYGSHVAPFDASSFDATVPYEVVQAAGRFMSAAFADRTVYRTMKMIMHEMSCAPLILDQTVLARRGGVSSGCASTSLVDGVAQFIMLMYVICTETGTSIPEALRQVGTKHCGDDLLVVVSDEMAAKITPNTIRARYAQYFGVKLTFGDKVEGSEMSWLTPSQAEFCSRSFLRHPHDRSIFISKLKWISVVGALKWTNSTDDVETWRQMREMMVEVFPHGKHLFNQVRTALISWSRKRGLGEQVHSYEEMSDIFRSKAKLKDLQFDIPVAFLRRTTSQKPNQIKVKPFEVINMGRKDTETRQAFTAMLTKARDLEEVKQSPTTAAYAGLPCALSNQRQPHQTSVGRKVGLIPNSPIFWKRFLGSNTTPEEAHFFEALSKDWNDFQPSTTSDRKRSREMRLARIFSAPCAASLDEIRAWSGVNTPTIPEMDREEAVPAPMKTAPTQGALQPFASDVDSTTVATVTPPAVTGGSGGTASNVLAQMGGMDDALLARGSFANSILAAAYADVPLQTLALGVTTAENTILYKGKFDPWDPAFTGPWIGSWAGLHERFTGSLEFSIQVASAGTILGKIAVYYLPTGVNIAKPSRMNLSPFEHVIIDLQMPSAQSIQVRPSSDSRFYMQKSNRKEDFGSILVLAYTAIQNTFGAQVSPPAYLTVRLGADAMFTLPTAAAQQPATRLGAGDPIPPSPPMGTRIVPDGYNPFLYQGEYSLSEFQFKFGRQLLVGGVEAATAVPWIPPGRFPFNRCPRVVLFPASSPFALSGIVPQGVLDSQGGGTTDVYVIDSTPRTPMDFSGAENNFALYTGMTITPATQIPIAGLKAPGESKYTASLYITPDSVGKWALAVWTSSKGSFSSECIVFDNPTLTTVIPLKPNTKYPIDMGVTGSPARSEISVSGVPVATRGAIPNFPSDTPASMASVVFARNSTFGVPAVLPGVTGTTVPTNLVSIDFSRAVKSYLDATKLRAIVLRGQALDGQSTVYLTCNEKGTFASTFQTALFSTRFVDSYVWFIESVHTESQFPPIPRCSSDAFAQRTIAEAAMAGAAAMGAAGSITTSAFNLGGSVFTVKKQAETAKYLQSQQLAQNKDFFDRSRALEAYKANLAAQVSRDNAALAAKTSLANKMATIAQGYGATGLSQTTLV